MIAFPRYLLIIKADICKNFSLYYILSNIRDKRHYYYSANSFYSYHNFVDITMSDCKKWVIIQKCHYHEEKNNNYEHFLINKFTCCYGRETGPLLALLWEPPNPKMGPIELELGEFGWPDDDEAVLLGAKTWIWRSREEL